MARHALHAWVLEFQHPRGFQTRGMLTNADADASNHRVLKQRKRHPPIQGAEAGRLPSDFLSAVSAHGLQLPGVHLCISQLSMSEAKLSVFCQGPGEMVLAHERLKAMQTCQMCGAGIERRRLLSHCVALTPDPSHLAATCPNVLAAAFCGVGPPQRLALTCCRLQAFLACVDGKRSVKKSKTAKSAAASCATLGSQTQCSFTRPLLSGSQKGPSCGERPPEQLWHFGHGWPGPARE